MPFNTPETLGTLADSLSQIPNHLENISVDTIEKQLRDLSTAPRETIGKRLEELGKLVAFRIARLQERNEQGTDHHIRLEGLRKQIEAQRKLMAPPTQVYAPRTQGNTWFHVQEERLRTQFPSAFQFLGTIGRRIGEFFGYAKEKLGGLGTSVSAVVVNIPGLLSGRTRLSDIWNQAMNNTASSAPRLDRIRESMVAAGIQIADVETVPSVQMGALVTLIGNRDQAHFLEVAAQRAQAEGRVITTFAELMAEARLLNTFLRANPQQAVILGLQPMPPFPGQYQAPSPTA